jgi:hypothetical protein
MTSIVPSLTHIVEIVSCTACAAHDSDGICFARHRVLGYRVEILPAPPLGSFQHPLSHMLPRDLILIVMLVISKYGLSPNRVAAVELFAGAHSVSNGLKAFGFATVPRPNHVPVRTFSVVLPRRYHVFHQLANVCTIS